MSVYSVKARLGVLLVLALAGLGAAGTVQPAQAQFFGFWGYRSFHWGIGVRDVAAIVREHGMRLIARPYRNRNVYVADAVDAYGHHRRLIIDGGNGDVLEIYNTDAAHRREFAAPIPPANIPHAPAHHEPEAGRAAKKHPPHHGLKSHARRPHKMPHAKPLPQEKAVSPASQEKPATATPATPAVPAPVVNAPAPAGNSTETPTAPKPDTTTPKSLTPVEPATTAAPNTLPPAPAQTPTPPPAAAAPASAPNPAPPPAPAATVVPPAETAPTVTTPPAETAPAPAPTPATAPTTTPAPAPVPAAPAGGTTPAPDKKVNDVPVAPLN